MKNKEIIVLVYLFASVISVSVAEIEYDDLQDNDGLTAISLRDSYLEQNLRRLRTISDSANENIDKYLPIKPLYNYLRNHILNEWDEWEQKNHYRYEYDIFGQTNLTKLPSETFECLRDLYETSYIKHGYFTGKSYEKLSASYDRFLNCKGNISDIPYIQNWTEPMYFNLIEFSQNAELDLIDGENIQANVNIRKNCAKILIKNEKLFQHHEKNLINELPEKLGHLHYIERIISQVYEKLFEQLVNNSMSSNHKDSFMKSIDELEFDLSDDIDNTFSLLLNSTDENGLNWKQLNKDDDDRKCLIRLYGQSYLSYYGDYARSDLMKIYLIDEFDRFLQHCSKSTKIAHMKKLISFINQQLTEIYDLNDRQLSMLVLNEKSFENERKLIVIKRKINQIFDKYPDTFYNGDKINSVFK